jgi:hypothetical protein
MVTIVLSIVLSLAATAVGVWFFVLGGSAKRKVTIDLKETGRVDPEQLGAHFEMKIGGTRVKNVVLFELTVSNRSFQDVPADKQELEDSSDRVPRVELPIGVRALVDPWTPDPPASSRNVKVARNIQHEQQMLYIYVHRLVKRSEVRTRIVCHYLEGESPPPISPESVRFYPGYMQDTKIKPSGLLKRPPSLLES